MRRTLIALLSGAALAAQACRENLGPDASGPIRLKGMLIFSSADRENRAEAGQLYRMRLDGTDLRPIPLGIAYHANEPAVSPDGLRIAYTSRGDIHVVDADGGNDHILTPDPASDTWPVWSPDGHQIAFTSNRDGPINVSGIFVMDADGSNLRRLVASADAPNWSPDGSRLAFTSADAIGRHIFTVALADGQVTPVTTGPFLDDSPAWSPDGNQFVFGSTRGTTNELYVMNVDGSNIRRLPIPGSFGRWSPDGRRIAFQCTGPNLKWRVGVINADGSGFAFLAADSTVSDFNPAWSP